jgi:hypothetical protein
MAHTQTLIIAYNASEREKFGLSKGKARLSHGLMRRERSKDVVF